MNNFLLAFFLLSILAWYLSFLATRLNRLHHRVETSWANLDGLLQRRAAVAIEIARSEISDPAASMLLTFAAHQAREANLRDRSQAETGLTGALKILLESSDGVTTPIEKELIQELQELTEKIKVAISMHVESVTRTHMVRKMVMIRLFRLAGSAPLPVIYEFEGDVF
jgi:cell division protein FtsB